MALPTYNKAKRKKAFTPLPKGAYVVEIKGAREDSNKSGSGSHLTIAFDIAEGEYAGYYQKRFDDNPNEDKKWPNDATYYLTVPGDDSQSFIWDNWNTFFADLEDSNNGYVFSGKPKDLKGKKIGGKFHIEQTSFNGNIYDHTRLRWTCVADDVRSGNAGALPKDKLIAASLASNMDDYATGFENAELEEDLPF